MIRRWWFPASIVLYLILRLYFAVLPGYVNDVQSYKDWAIGVAVSGLVHAYDKTGVDYPPLFLYVLYAIGKVYLVIHPATPEGTVADSSLLTFLIKLPHLVFDLALGGLLYRLVCRGGLWATRTGPAWGAVAASCYLWNPAVLWGSAYWGQPDSVHSALALMALAALGYGQTARSGGLLCAAGLMKPLAAPLVPLLAIAAWGRRRWRGFVSAGLGGLGVAVAVFLPFAIGGTLPGVLRRVFVDIEAMPFTSVNGHNLWWILGGWRDANAAIVGPLTAKQIGLALFLAAYAALVIRNRRWLFTPQPEGPLFRRRLFVVAGAITSSFFFLSTHMHENHLFMAVPLLIAVGGSSRLLARLALIASVAVFANMALHDPSLPEALPGFLAWATEAMDPHLGRPYTVGQVVGSIVTTLLVAFVAGGSFLAAWRLPKDQRTP